MAKKNDITDFLSALEGYHQVCKMIHWSTINKAQHTLVDEIDGEILGFEDRIAECAMGILDTSFGFGDLKALLPNSKELEFVIKELQKDLFDLRGKLQEPQECGLINIIDEFIEKTCSWTYLQTLD